MSEISDIRKLLSGSPEMDQMEMLSVDETFWNSSELQLLSLNESFMVDFTTAVPVTQTKIPREMAFNADNLVSVITYCVLFVIAAAANLTVFVILVRNRRRKSRVNLIIMHLALADLLVTFIMLPMEIAWHITVAWTAGDAACRILMFFRTFGFYLSSFILITISLDRYFAIMHPLSLSDADRRAKIMIGFAWAMSIIASAPQVGYIYVSNLYKTKYLYCNYFCDKLEEGLN